jgi:hypothetical protein
MSDHQTVWSFDLGKGSIGEAVETGKKKEGLRLAPAPVQELRMIGWPALRADSLDYQPPQVLISPP